MASSRWSTHSELNDGLVDFLSHTALFGLFSFSFSFLFFLSSSFFSFLLPYWSCTYIFGFCLCEVSFCVVFGGLLFLIFNEREIKDMEVGGWKGGEDLGGVV